MAFVLAAYGTDGDIIPMIKLGENLIEMGYSSILIGEDRLVNRFRSATLHLIGVETKSTGNNNKKPYQRINQNTLRSWNDGYADSYQKLYTYLKKTLNCNDVLISSSSFIVADVLVQEIGCLWIEVGLNAASFLLSPVVRKNPGADQNWDEASRKYKTYLSELNNIDYQEIEPDLRLIATPREFQSRRYKSKPCTHTGFWTSDVAPNYNDQPQSKGIDLSIDSDYMLVCFSSQWIEASDLKINLYSELANLTGRKLIILKNKALQPTEDHEHIIWAEPGNYLQLLEHRPLVLTHGGLGSFSAALRAGCEIVLEPQTPEQFMTAYIASKLNLARVIDSQSFEPTALAEFINSNQTTGHISSVARKTWFNGIETAVHQIIKTLQQKNSALYS